MKILPLLVGLALSAIEVPAAYLEKVPITLQQPDGREIRCYASGDEYYNWVHDANGFTILKHPHTGFYVYALKAKGSLIASDWVVGRVDPKQAGLQPFLNLSPEQVRRQRAASLLATQDNPVEQRPAPNTGTMENLVVFVRFAGEKEFTDAISDYERAFNSTAPGAVSLYNYMREISYGALQVHSSFYPIPTGATVISYQDAQPRGYYKPKSEDPLGYASPSEQAQREQTLLKNAIEAIRSQVPSELNLDGDGDGRVDNVVFILSGSPTAWNTLLWPHAWAMYMYTITINGKRVYGYNIQLQSFMVGGQIHLICHELLHSIGFPDLYHYAFDGLHPVQGWDIMASPTSPPQHPGAYTKWKYGKWIPSLPLIEHNGLYSINPLAMDTNNCYKILSPNEPSGKQYFVVEYRRRSPDSFDRGLSGEGLLIYRIDNRDPFQNGNVTPPDEVYIYRPGGTPTTNGQISLAPLAADFQRTIMNDHTDPACFLADGSAGGIYIYDVSPLGPSMSFRIGHAVPEMPTLLSPANRAIDVSLEPTLSWSPISGADHYHLQLSLTADFLTPLHDANLSSTLFKATNLQENTPYYWRLRATNSQGDGPWSEVWQFTTRGLPPQPPTGVKVINWFN